MELRTFIHKALTDIIGGVQDAQNVVPPDVIVPSVADNYKSVETGISQFQSVEFEVAVKADERSGSEAKLNVVAAIFNGGVKGESGATSGHSATLKFKVPIKLPQNK